MNARRRKRKRVCQSPAEWRAAIAAMPLLPDAPRGEHFDCAWHGRWRWQSADGRVALYGWIEEHEESGYRATADGTELEARGASPAEAMERLLEVCRRRCMTQAERERLREIGAWHDALWGRRR